MSSSAGWAMYPTMRSIGQGTKFTIFHFLYVWLRISQPGFLQSALNFTWRFGHISDRFSPILGGQPQGWPSSGRQQGPYGGICFLLKHLLYKLIDQNADSVCVDVNQGETNCNHTETCNNACTDPLMSSDHKPEIWSV